ncbi:fluoroquinolones export ATP-binding proteinc [Oxobacter pfennigii]|uniref:Fluoroquinolones export ATP-binding proteinc n=1 Tax=Oxobacter pfennigii TaxID=36849 RepID=A0A0P8W8V4_9CLOT|nr:ABC transporter ATP-binding protein [Oxobacter pfennigii]KPU44437.1 fluoroquinolones export ATP-binding proteinc [Oxobacter pfennigii]
MISVQNVFLKYPASKADTMRGISFDVKQGEIFGFLGPSGAGKSTLQKILTGVLRKYRGSVRVIDIEVKNRTNAFYENIGVDFEFPNFYGKFTALENLKYFASLYSAKTADPMMLLDRVGLLDDADKKVGNFSKGMKMRLGFVRCLIHNPKLLFLDEPTSGLDPANARILKNMILEQKKMGKTVILTTHNMHDAEELCDRVAFIADGKIKAMDTPHSLRKSGGDVKVEYSFTSDGREAKNTCLLAELGASADFQFALKYGTLTSIHSKEQTLEDVFITITGRCLQ